MTSLTPTELREVRKMCDSKFIYFVQTFIPHFGTYDFYDPLFHGPLCDYLEDSTSLDRLLVMPRAHGKTTIITLYMLWRGSKEPNIRILYTSNSQDNAAETIHALKGIVEQNAIYQAVYSDRIPSFHGRSTKWSDTSASLKRTIDHGEATFSAAGIGTNLTKRHFNLIIEDDTITPKKDSLTDEEMMPTKDDIEKAIGFHKLTLSLLDHPKRSERVFVGTRWSPDDVIEYIMEEEHNDNLARWYSKLDVPSIDPDTGEPNYKEYDLETQALLRARYGSIMYSMLYLNTPLSSDLMQFRPAWTKYYEEGELPDDGDTIVTIDPADPPTGKSSQDYSATIVAKHCKRGLFVRAIRRRRITHGELIRESLDLAKEYKANKIRVEVNKYCNLEDGFRTEMAKRAATSATPDDEYFHIDAVKAKGKKEGRIKGLTPLFENGVVFLKTESMKELEDEMYKWQGEKSRGHDDLLDALAWQMPKSYFIPSEFASEEGEGLDVEGEVEEIKQVERKPYKRCNTFNLQTILNSMSGNRHLNVEERWAS